MKLLMLMVFPTLLLRAEQMEWGNTWFNWFQQKNAWKTQHMLYFWKAVQGCQILHSHVSIPFNSPPISYLTSLNTRLFKNIAYVGSFKHFSVQLFYMYFTTRPRPALTPLVYMCTIFAFNRFLINKYRLWANIRYDLTHMWCWSGLGIFHRKPISFFLSVFPLLEGTYFSTFPLVNNGERQGGC